MKMIQDLLHRLDVTACLNKPLTVYCIVEHEIHEHCTVTLNETGPE